jgi:hypothetical protein
MSYVLSSSSVLPAKRQQSLFMCDLRDPVAMICQHFTSACLRCVVRFLREHVHIDDRPMIVTMAPHDAPTAKITPTSTRSPATIAHAQHSTAAPHNAPHANIAKYILRASNADYRLLLKLRLSGNYTHRHRYHVNKRLNE